MNLFIWLNCISRYLSLKILPFHWNWKRGKWVIFFFPEKRMSLLLLISNNYMQSSACLCRLFCQLILETTKSVSVSSLVPYQQNHHPCWLVHVKIVGTLSNHDDDGIVKRESHKFAYLTTKNSSFARFARAFLIFFFTFRRRPRSFYVKWPVLQLWGRRGHIMTNVQFCRLISEALVPI